MFHISKRPVKYDVLSFNSLTASVTQKNFRVMLQTPEVTEKQEFSFLREKISTKEERI